MIANSRDPLLHVPQPTEVPDDMIWHHGNGRKCSFEAAVGLGSAALVSAYVCGRAEGLCWHDMSMCAADFTFYQSPQLFLGADTAEPSLLALLSSVHSYRRPASFATAPLTSCQMHSCTGQCLEALRRQQRGHVR